MVCTEVEICMMSIYFSLNYTLIDAILGFFSVDLVFAQDQSTRSNKIFSRVLYQKTQILEILGKYAIDTLRPNYIIYNSAKKQCAYSQYNTPTDTKILPTHFPLEWPHHQAIISSPLLHEDGGPPASMSGING